MHPELRALVELQAIDDRIAALKRELVAIPSRVESENRLLKSFEDSVAEAQKAVESVKKRQRDTEREIQSTEQKLREARGKQALVKTNDEFRALSSEIAQLEGQVGSLEDAALEIMESLPAAEKRLAEEKGELDRAKGQVQGAVSRHKAEGERLEKSLQTLLIERQTVAAAVSSPWQERYERFYKGRGGLAVCPIIEQTCQGCRMSETLQRFFEIRDSEDTIFTCANCGRIIFYKEKDAVGAISNSEEAG